MFSCLLPSLTTGSYPLLALASQPSRNEWLIFGGGSAGFDYLRTVERIIWSDPLSGSPERYRKL
jgi:hypothetical protein